MKTFLQGFAGGLCAVLLLGAATLAKWGPSIVVSDTLYVGSDNAVQISQPTSDTLKILIDPDNEQAGFKELQIYTGDHATNPVVTFTNDGDSMLVSSVTDAGGGRWQIGADGTSSSFRRIAAGAVLGVYENGNIGIKLGSQDGSDFCIWYDSQFNTLAKMDSDGNTTFSVGLAIPYGTALPTGVANGGIAVDSDASANGSLYVYGNGSWRKVADLP